MSDPLDAALRGLRGQRPPVPFAAPETVRRRGRQRTTQQVMVAGIAVLAVLGGTAGWLSGYERGAGPNPPPGATTPPSSSAAPTRSASPDATPSTTRSAQPSRPPFLTIADLGPGNWQPMSGAETFEGSKSIWGPDRCPDDPAWKHPTLAGIVEYDSVSYNTGAGQRRITHAIERYPAGTGSARLAEIRAQLQRCSRTTKWPDRTAPTRYTVTQLSGVGDGAFLVLSEHYVYVGDTEEISREPMLVTLDAVVRVGDRIASITTFNTAMSPMEEDLVRSLVAKAAQRLR